MPSGPEQPALLIWLLAGLLGAVALLAGWLARSWQRERGDRQRLEARARHDVDALQEVERARVLARAADQRWREVLDAIPGAVAVYDNQDRLLALNREAALQAPYRGLGDPIGMTHEDLLRRALAAAEVPEALGREEEWLALSLAGRAKASGLQARMPEDGPWVHGQVQRTASGYLVMSRLDIGPLVEKGLALERAHEQLLRVSTTDGLTGLANRRQFELTLQSEWQRSARSRARIALVMIDIDQFRHYNKIYGHQAGDECLRQLARLLGLSVKRSGELVARYDGDAFALLLPGADAAEARRVAERCLEQIHSARIPHAEAALSPWLTASVGLAAQAAAPGVSSAALVDEALQSLQGAKRAGGDRLPVPPVAAEPPQDEEAPASQPAGL